MAFVDKALLILCGACLAMGFGIWMGIMHQANITKEMDQTCKTRFGQDWEVRRKTSFDYCVGKDGDIKYI